MRVRRPISRKEAFTAEAPRSAEDAEKDGKKFFHE
jgi:hypothetical protein